MGCRLLAVTLALVFASSLWAAPPPQQEEARMPVTILLKEPVRAEQAQAIGELGGVVQYRYSIINDVQTVTAEWRPADLDVKTSLFAADGHSWSLGTTNGTDQVVWEFSHDPDGVGWTAYESTDTLYPLAPSAAQGATKTFISASPCPPQPPPTKNMRPR